MTTKIACTSFSSHPTARPSATGSCLQTSWAALSIIPFLYIPQYLVMREGVKERHADWETARLVCKVWNKYSKYALQIQFCSRISLDIKNLWMYYKRHPAIADTPCPRLNTLIADNDGQSWYNRFPRSAVQSLLRHASGLKDVQCHPPFNALLADISIACSTLTSLSLDYFILNQAIPEFEPLILDIAAGCPNIKHLALTDSASGRPMFNCSQMIDAMHSLTSLELNMNEFDKDEMEAIGNSSVTSLSLVHCRVDNHALLGRHLGKVTNLYYSQEDQGQSDAFFLAESLDRLCALLNGCTQLTSLNLSDAIDLRDEGLPAVGACCPLLTDLDLRFFSGETDFFTLAGYEALLQSCPTLTHLDLTDRKISQEDLASLRKTYPAVKIIG
jgi:hypothetical protein